jgi:polyisoprenoid-binding protein YceI
MRARSLALLVAGLALALAACAQPTASPEPTAPPTAAPAQPTAEPAPAEEPTAVPVEAASPTEPAAEAASGGQLVWVLAAEGNEARYLVTEQLADLEFPNDAIGVTTSISGQIVIQANGAVVAEGSKFEVDLTTLASDRSMRDRFVQRETLQTSTFPLAEFVPTAVTGLPSPLPTSGEVTFQLTGDMIVHGVTRPTTWEVTGQVNGEEFAGTAKTNFTFADFGLTIPKVARVLSVEDNIRLEYAFRLVREAS